MKVTANEFIGLLASQEIWKYELEFVGFVDKYAAEVISVVPKTTKDGKVLLQIIGKEIDS